MIATSAKLLAERCEISSESRGAVQCGSCETCKKRNVRQVLPLACLVQTLSEALEDVRQQRCVACAEPMMADVDNSKVLPNLDGTVNYWHWGIGTGEKPACTAPEERAALAAVEALKL